MMEKVKGDLPDRKQGEGSITLFLTLVLTLIFSLCFSLLEAARVQAFSEIAARSLLLELESAFGEYQADLWQDYGLLFLDGGDAGGALDLTLLEGHRMEEAALGQKEAGFFQIVLKGFEITGFTLATDNYGAAFEKQAVAAIQAQLAAGMVEAIRGKTKKGKEIAEKSRDLEKQWESAKDAMVEAEESGQDAGMAEATGQEKGADVRASSREGKVTEMEKSFGRGRASGSPAEDLPENPVESVDLLKNSPTLNFVVENPSGISGKAIMLADRLADREKAQGNLNPPDVGSLDKLLFLQYLDGYFSCASGFAQKGGQGHALEYELEYCVAGRGSDRENLEKTVKELLLIREAGNFMTIIQDGKKQALALEIATAAVGFTGIVPLVEAVKIGILLAWSYIESILDVRCLLSGGKVPLVKAVSDWKSDVSLGEEVLTEKGGESESRENGLDYREYLQILLMLVPEQTLVWRAMDIVERNVALKKPFFRMDSQIHGMQAEGLYTAEPLFLGFVTVGKTVDGTYHFRRNSGLTYLE